jgi:hypothetical protein
MITGVYRLWGPFGLLLYKMRVIRPLHNSPLELAAINL